MRCPSHFAIRNPESAQRVDGSRMNAAVCQPTIAIWRTQFPSRSFGETPFGRCHGNEPDRHVATATGQPIPGPSDRAVLLIALTRAP